MPPKGKAKKKLNTNKKKNYIIDALTGKRLRVHGNWVGPGWSAGEDQESVIAPNVPAIDKWDQAAKEHDETYKYIEDHFNANKYPNRVIDKERQEEIKQLELELARQKSKALERADEKYTKANNTTSLSEFISHPLDSLLKEASSAAVNVQRIYRDVTNKDPQEEFKTPDLQTIEHGKPITLPESKPGIPRTNLNPKRLNFGKSHNIIYHV